MLSLQCTGSRKKQRLPNQQLCFKVMLIRFLNHWLNIIKGDLTYVSNSLGLSRIWFLNTDLKHPLCHVTLHVKINCGIKGTIVFYWYLNTCDIFLPPWTSTAREKTLWRLYSDQTCFPLPRSCIRRCFCIVAGWAKARNIFCYFWSPGNLFSHFFLSQQLTLSYPDFWYKVHLGNLALEPWIWE